MDRVIALRQISVTAVFYLEDTRRIHPRSVLACQPKEKRLEKRVGEGEREKGQASGRERESALAPPFMFFPPPGPALCKLGLARSAVCST